MSYILSEPIGGWTISNYTTYFSIPGTQTFDSASITGSTKLNITSDKLPTVTQVRIDTHLTVSPFTPFIFFINGTGKLKNSSLSIVKVGDNSTPAGCSVIGAGQIKVKSV